MSFLSYLINGISLGSVYAIIALGYTMVYGIAKMLNFAHGDVIMIGAYVVFTAMTGFNVNPIVSVIIAMVVCTVLGIVIERVAYKPLRNASSNLAVLITAIGVSIFLQNLAQLIFGSSGKAFPAIIDAPPISVGSMQISMVTIVTIIASVVLMIGLQLLVNKTKMGKAMRAVSEDAGAAMLMGINTNGTVAFTFGLGAALAAVGAVLYGASYPMITPFIGSMLGLKAFVAAVLGGIGNIPGAMLGGYIMGIAESLTKGYISTQLADAVVFGILIVVLLVKPSGIMGKHATEKV